MNRREDIQRLSLVSPDRLEILLKLLQSTEFLGGVNAEVGVYRGGTALLIAANSKKRLYAFDTFEGLPKPGPVDKHIEGEFKCPYEEVEAVLSDFPHACLVRATFPDCMHQFHQIKQCSFVYLDVDLYQSTRDAIEFFWPRMVEHGILVTDDYGWEKTPGVKMAWDEFFPNSNVENKLAWIQKK